MKRIAKRVAAGTALLSLVAAGGAWGWSWWDEGRSREWTDNAYVRADITAISPKVSGYVAEVLVDDNQMVEAGAVLLRIADEDHRAQRDRAASAIAQAEAATENLARRKDLQLAKIREAEAAVDVGRADVELSRRELARATRLVDQGWTPQRNHDTATANSDRARAALAQAEAVAAAAREQLAVLDSETRQIDARLAEARANLQLAEIALADTVIRAPVAGVVGNRRVHAGEYVRPGAALLSVVPVDAVWVVANFKETQVARMAVGQPVEIRVDGYSDAVIRGRVDSLAPASGAAFSLLPPDNATGNFVKIVQRVPVKITLPAGHSLLGRLVPGLSVDVAVEVGPSPGTAAAAEGEPSQADARIFRTANDAS
jgi:membrane fusion protein (multidrug efflux system)